MEHNLFKPHSFEEGQHEVVGDCVNTSMQERWDKETPVFAKAIIDNIPTKDNAFVLDYGCGVGRLAKEVLLQRPNTTIIGTDASVQMLEQAYKYVDN